MREEAKAQRLEEPQAYLAGSDLDPKVIEMAAANITAAGLEDCIRLSVRDVKDAVAPAQEAPGIVLTNPPYGERIGEEAEMTALYKTIGDTLKANFQGYDAFVFTGNLEAAKSIGLKAKRRTPLFNGPIDCRLLKYELYQGSRRALPPAGTSPPGPLSEKEGEPDDMHNNA